MTKFEKLKDIIHQVFEKAQKIILNSIQGIADDINEEQSIEYQMINEDLAAKILLKQIEIY